MSPSPAGAGGAAAPPALPLLLLLLLALPAPALAAGPQYDDRAAAFFSIAVLTVLAVPSALYIAWVVLTHRSRAAAGAAGAASAAGAKGAAAGAAAGSLLAVAPRTAREAEKAAALRAKQPVRALWTTGLTACAVLTAVALVAAFALVLSVRNTTLNSYDPYSILGLPIGASDLEIKRAYRTLSRTHHPDKGGDQEMFQKISKAYDALIDPEARANWEKFGNPDGKQPLEVAIGIPSFVLHAQGRYAFLLAYLGAVVVACLYMRRVWRSTKGKTIHNLLQGSLVHIQRRLLFFSRVAPRALPEIYSGLEDLAGLEYAAEDTGELQAILEGLVKDPKAARIFFGNDENGVPTATGVARSNAVLLHAHLNRAVGVTVESPRLRALLPPLLAHVPAFVAYSTGLLNQFQHQHQYLRARKAPNAGESRLELAYEVVQFGAQATQALFGRDSSLLQVFSPQEASAVLSKRPGFGIHDLLDLPPPQREERVAQMLAAGGLAGTKLEERRDEVRRVLDDLPLISASLRFGVKHADADQEAKDARAKAKAARAGAGAGAGAGADEDDEEEPEPVLQPEIYEGNFITAVFTLRHLNLERRAGPGAAGARAGARAAVPPVFAPHFPHDVAEEWHCWVLDGDGRVLHQGADEQAPPFYFVLRPTSGTMRHVVEGIIAPPAEHKRLRVVVRSSVYIGLDLEVAAELRVRRKEDEPVERHDEAAPDAAAAAAAAGAGDEEDEDDADGLALGDNSEVIERLMNNADLSDVSDEEDAGDGKGGRGADAPADGGEAKAGAQAQRSMNLRDDDDGWLPSILAGAQPRRRPVKKGAKGGGGGKGGKGGGGGGGGGGGAGAGAGASAEEGEGGEDVD